MVCRTIVVSAVLALMSGLLAQDAGDEAGVRQLQAAVEQAVHDYDLSVASEAKTAMRAVVALRWLNATRGQQTEDLMVLWSHEGRPQAVGSIFPSGRDVCHELASVSRQGTMIARDKEGRVVWSPAKPGVEFKDVPDADEPAATEAGRLRQMKSVASRFSATMTGYKPDNSDREELRLLPRPIYRYDLKTAGATHADLVDGAVFAFVQGTDPEAVLLLEAVKTADRVQWQYAFARATGGGLETRLGDGVVWTVAKFDQQSQTPQNPQVVLRRPLKQ